jgi:ATP-dependent helicase Lhr and Lhr-like helicase
VQVERIVRGRTQLVLIHCLAGRAVNQALSWVAAHRLAAGQSAVSNSDDHGHLLVLPAKLELDPARLRNAYAPARFLDDLECVLRGIETLGRKFRAVAETGQLMPKRSVGRAINRRFAQWNASLLYETLLRYEPDHLLLRETVREVMDDVLDSDRGAAEARRLFESEWEWFEQPRPSPFALPIYMAFNRDVLLAQDPHGAFAEFAETLYEEWAG